MLISKEPRIVDKAYRDSARNRPCENCGAEDGTIVGAHPRAGNAGGTGLKPSDSLLLFLCFKCHQSQETGGQRWLARFLLERFLHLSWPEHNEPSKFECGWIVQNILHPMLIRRYEIWKVRHG